MDATSLSGYVSAAPGDTPFVVECWAQATTLVTRQIGSASVPDEIKDLAIREVGADLFHRRRTRNGIASFAGDDMTPIRVTRDPMKAAEPILAPWLPGGFA